MSKEIASLTLKNIPQIEEISDEVAANISGGFNKIKVTVDGGPTEAYVDEWLLFWDIASGNIKVTYK